MAAPSNKKKAVEENIQRLKQAGWPGFNSIVLVAMALLLIYLQAILWIGEGSLAEVRRLKQSIEALEAKNEALTERNQKLISEVEALRNGLELIEYRAREDLGLIKEGEVFFHVIDDDKSDSRENQ